MKNCCHSEDSSTSWRISWQVCLSFQEGWFRWFHSCICPRGNIWWALWCDSDIGDRCLKTAETETGFDSFSHSGLFFIVFSGFVTAGHVVLFVLLSAFFGAVVAFFQVQGYFYKISYLLKNSPLSKLATSSLWKCHPLLISLDSTMTWSLSATFALRMEYFLLFRDSFSGMGFYSHMRLFYCRFLYLIVGFLLTDDWI